MFTKNMYLLMSGLRFNVFLLIKVKSFGNQSGESEIHQRLRLS